MQSGSRFIIGIDLGTTNTAVAYVDTRSAAQQVLVFAVPQLVAPGELQPRTQLPSFIYLAGSHDLTAAESSLPWQPEERRVVGELARNQGARVPARMVASAKSWLCHGGVDRNAAILPWGDAAHGEAQGGPNTSDERDKNDNRDRASEANVPNKLSPVAAQALVLAHIRDAWDHSHLGADCAFVDQEIIVTVPASFDEAARELTLAAARTAGFPEVVLLEEPQAAFYAWIDAHPPAERAQRIRPGDNVLVFDIGGGTTDFTLIAVAEEDSTPPSSTTDAAGDGGATSATSGDFARTAVGDHLLLGGDNIDLTLAKQVEARLVAKRKKKLDLVAWHGLVHACRRAKETLLSTDDVEQVPITVAGRGSKLIGGAMKDRIDRGELERTMFDGFFPKTAADEHPRHMRGGLQEFGLPYAADPAVTRHLAAFLARHHTDRIDAVLFNGGTMNPAGLRQRVLDQLAHWQPDAPSPRELANQLPELAVAKGAAYYGLVRRGLGARIRGGTPRAFYIGVGHSENAPATVSGDMALCLAPKGLEDGARHELARDFELLTNRPVSFKLYSSSSRSDRPGDLVPVGDGRPDTIEDGSDLLQLPPIVTVLRAPGRARVTVHLEVRITELGALEIWCREADGEGKDHWRLSFDMRAGGATSGDRDEDASAKGGELDPETEIQLQRGKDILRQTFSGGRDGLASIMKALEKGIENRREEWSMTLTRGLFDAAMEVEETRTRSAEHEQRWLNLTGFCLRPGTGAPLDQWRAKQMWRIFNQELTYPKNESCRLAWWIVWRRIAGGLTKGQQEQIYDRLAQLFLPGQKQRKKWYKVKPTPQEAAEMVRTLANLERLSTASKIKLGDEFVRRIIEDSGGKKDRNRELYFWGLGRIAARVPLYGPLNAVVPPQRAAAWLEQVLGQSWSDKSGFPMAQVGRRTGDRSRDLSDDMRKALATRLRTMDGGQRMAHLVEEIVELEAREERVALGDTLPAGLRLVADPDEQRPRTAQDTSDSISDN